MKLKNLIHNKKSKESQKKTIIYIIIVSIIYCFHQESIKILYLFQFNGLDIWTFDIIFILIFMNAYFIINIYKHQKFSIIFILITNSFLLLISAFLPFSKHDDKEDGEIYLRDNNTFDIIDKITGSKYNSIMIFIIFILISFLISYGRVKAKVLMDFNFISPYGIIIFIGLIGTILVFIGIITANIFECKGEEEIIKNYCLVFKDNTYYFDNILIYFKELRDYSYNKEFFLEVIVITPFILIIYFIEVVCEILTILYLNPNFLLIRDNLYYSLTRIIFILLHLNKNYQKYITLSQFIILELTEIFALFGYLIYLEIIELRFWELDNDLKINIINRGNRETDYKTLETTNEDEFDESFRDDEDNKS